MLIRVDLTSEEIDIIIKSIDPSNEDLIKKINYSVELSKPIDIEEIH
jgi:hypothetical protein